MRSAGLAHDTGDSFDQAAVTEVADGITLSPCSDRFGQQMAVARRITTKRRNALPKLAK